ncbi:MAG: recombinase RecB [Staphylothermus sp.]|nr:recombinase RecB [Staphylothermus sp.]
MYLVLYAPTSVQRIIDFLKTVYAWNNAVPVIIKPIGAAAQIGVPEAHRLAYKAGKPLIVLPEINDLREVLGLKNIYCITDYGETKKITDIVTEKTAFIISGGEQEPSKKELIDIETIKLEEIPMNIPATALTALILYVLSKKSL